LDKVLFVLGLFMLAWGCRQAKAARRAGAQGAEEIVLLQEELQKAKKDVGLLLAELNSVSEKVVNEISEKIRAAEEVKIKVPAPSTVEVDPVAAETVERIARSVSKSQAKKEQKVIDLNLHKQNQEAAVTRPAGGRFETVYTLADLGYSISEIAKQLQMGKGEVELILSLRHKEENVLV